jgi:hypothetical protein
MTQLKSAIPVERVAAPTRAVFEERYVRPSRPVVLTSAVSGWPALKRWNPAYLREKIGALEVGFKSSASDILPDYWSEAGNIHSKRLKAPLSEYLDLILAPRKPDGLRYYLSGDEVKFVDEDGKVNPAMAPLAQDFTPPPYFDRAVATDSGFWVSAGGITSALHYDGDGHHNLNVQVAGEKVVTLFSPWEARNVYPNLALQLRPFNFSQVSAIAPDLEAFPRYAQAERFEARLSPGDMLFIPSFWFHTLRHVGDLNLNVNFWWKPDAPQLTPPAMRKVFIESIIARFNLGRKPALPRLLEAFQSLEPGVVEYLAGLEESLINAEPFYWSAGGR